MTRSARADLKHRQEERWPAVREKIERQRPAPMLTLAELTALAETEEETVTIIVNRHAPPPLRKPIRLPVLVDGVRVFGPVSSEDHDLVKVGGSYNVAGQWRVRDIKLWLNPNTRSKRR